MLARIRSRNPIRDIQRRAERTLATLRTAEPEQTMVPKLPDPQATALIAASWDIADAVRQVTQTFASTAPEPVLIVPDNRTGSRPNPHAAFTLLSEGLASRDALASIALPSATSRAWRRRWENLATRAGIPVEPLGDEGWARISFEGIPTTLESVDLPLELPQSGTVIALSSSVTPDGCIGMWRDVVHPNSALRARVGGVASIAELALAVDATYLLTSQVGSLRIAALAHDRVLAELLALGLHRLREQPLGIEAAGPWEDPAVQRLIEIGAGVTRAASITLHMSHTPMRDNALEPLRRLAELLGVRVEDVPAIS